MIIVCVLRRHHLKRYRACIVFLNQCTILSRSLSCKDKTSHQSTCIHGRACCRLLNLQVLLTASTSLIAFRCEHRHQEIFKSITNSCRNRNSCIDFSLSGPPTTRFALERRLQARYVDHHWKEELVKAAIKILITTNLIRFPEVAATTTSTSK